MWEALKSVAFVLLSVMVALILQAHAEVEEISADDAPAVSVSQSFIDHLPSHAR